MKKLLVIIACISFIVMPHAAQNFGRYPKGTSPEDIVIPSVTYTKDLEKSAKKDNDGSLTLQLADCYMYELGVAKNEKKAIKLYKDAAEKFNNGEAMLMLADYYVQNEKVELAYDYYLQAANAGYAPAQVIYGDMLQAYARKQYISKLDAAIKRLESERLPYNPTAYADTLSKQEERLRIEYDKLYKASWIGNQRTNIYDERMKELQKQMENLSSIWRGVRQQSQTREMKRQYEAYSSQIESIEDTKQDEQETYEWLTSSLAFRSKITEIITDEKDYITYYKKAAEQNYPEGMYSYAYSAKDYDYMPIVAEIGYYSLYTELEDYYYDKILNNEDVANSYSLLKKYSNLAEQHNEENQKELIAHIDANTPEYLISETKKYVETNKDIQNDQLVAMNYALTTANDTAKLNALLVQSIVNSYKDQKDQILNTLYSTLDKVSGKNKIKFCNDNVNNALYTDIIYNCLTHIAENDKEKSAIGDAWYILGLMAYDGKIANIDKWQRENVRDEYFAKAKSYGNRKAYDYATIKELESQFGSNYFTYYYSSLRKEKKNEFNRWDQKVIDNCRYWMLKGNTQACMDYAQALRDNHEGGFTPQFDSTIIDTYQRAIDRGNESALYMQKAYRYLYAGGFGMQSEFDNIKANGTPLEQIKFAQALIDMGDEEKALLAMQLALDANSADAYYKLYQLYYDNTIKNKDIHNPQKALEAFEKAVTLGMTEKIPELANAYIDGLHGHGRDEHKAVSWVKKGHEMGIKDCTAQYAWCYARGYDNIPVDFNKAQELMKEAGKSYDFSADRRHYELVKAAEKNDLKAIQTLIREYGMNAESSEKYACLNPAITDVEKYNSHARQEQMKWIKKGTALGDAESIRQLGWAYYYGWAGLTVDKNKTLSYLKQAAAKKSSEANYNLGWCYEYGMDGFITPNRRVAAEYYRTAYNLGGSRDCERAWLRCIN